MSFLSALVSFCAGVPDTHSCGNATDSDGKPEWDKIIAQGEKNESARIARLRKRESDEQIRQLRNVFSCNVSKLKDRILTYGSNCVEIHYLDWPIRTDPEHLEELARLCDEANVDVKYIYPRYCMSARTTKT